MKKNESKQVLISSEPRMLADEIIMSNPGHHYTLLHDALKFSDVYDFIFLTEKDFSRLTGEINSLKTPLFCVIYTDPNCEFNSIKPHPRIDCFMFGIIDEWVSQINEILGDKSTNPFDQKILIGRNERKDENLVKKTIKQLWGDEKVIKNLEDNLTFILTELISNSFNHSSSEEVVVEMRKGNKEVSLKVTNFDGTFLKSRFMECIFKKGTLISPDNRASGAGIGLYLVS